MVEIEEAPVDFDATQWGRSLVENNERVREADGFSVETRDAASTDGWSGSTEEVEDGRGEAEKKAQGPEAKKTSGTRRRAPGQQLAERRTKTPTKLRQEVHLKTIRLNKMY